MLLKPIKQFFKKYFRIGKVSPTKWSEGAIMVITRKTKGHCYLCGALLERGGDGQKKVLPIFRFSVEHLKPISRGGRNGRGNVVPTCWHCNGLKGSSTIEEMQGARYRRWFRETKLRVYNNHLNRFRINSPHDPIVKQIEELHKTWKLNYSGRYWFELHPDMVRIPKDLTGFQVFQRDMKFVLKRLVKRIRPMSLVNRAANSHRIAHVHPQRPHQEPCSERAGCQAASNDIAH